MIDKPTNPKEPVPSSMVHFDSVLAGGETSIRINVARRITPADCQRLEHATMCIRLRHGAARVVMRTMPRRLRAAA